MHTFFYILIIFYIYLFKILNFYKREKLFLFINYLLYSWADFYFYFNNFKFNFFINKFQKGNGFASFNTLVNLKNNELVFDISFIKEKLRSEKNEKIFKTVFVKIKTLKDFLFFIMTLKGNLFIINLEENMYLPFYLNFLIKELIYIFNKKYLIKDFDIYKKYFNLLNIDFIKIIFYSNFFKKNEKINSFSKIKFFVLEKIKLEKNELYYLKELE